QSAAGNKRMRIPYRCSPQQPWKCTPTSRPRVTGWWRRRREASKGSGMDEFSAHRLRNVIPVLIAQRNTVVSGGVPLAGHLIDLAIMQVRLTLHDISEEELSEFSNLLSMDLERSSGSEVRMPGRRRVILEILFAARG